MATATTPQPKDPQAGGRYKRLANGELQQLHKTEESRGRTRRSQAPAPAAAPADNDTKE